MPVNNQLVKQNNKPAQGNFSAFMTGEAIKKRVNQMIGEKDGLRFISSIVSAVATNPALSNCDYSTIFSSALLGETLRLAHSPQLGQYYMVPFTLHKGKPDERTVATFVLGYKGYLQLAIRSGYYKKINVLPIKEGELQSFDPLNEVIDAIIVEDEDLRELAPTVGYYCMFEYQNGFKKAMYWSKKKMIAHADRYSPAFSKDAVKAKNPKYNKVSFADFENGKVNDGDMWLYSSFWYKDFDGMACKTMLRQIISKWGIMSVELQTAFERDESILHDDGSFEYVDDSVVEQGPIVNVDQAPEPTSAGKAEENGNPPQDQGAGQGEDPDKVLFG